MSDPVATAITGTVPCGLILDFGVFGRITGHIFWNYSLRSLYKPIVTALGRYSCFASEVASVSVGSVGLNRYQGVCNCGWFVFC